MIAQRNSNAIPKSARFVVIGVGLFAVLSLLVVYWMRSGTPPAPLKSVAASLPRNIVLACPGRVEGRSEVIEVGAAMDGVLAAVRVQEGQRVVAGDVLAVIACRDLEADVQAARSLVESARQARQRLLRGSKDEERRISAEETAAAEARLQQAQLQHQRIAKLFANGDVSQAILEQAKRDLDVAQAAQRAAISQQGLVNAPPLPEEIAKADAELRAAEERVQSATAKLEKCVIRAPITGTVLRRHLKVGETVSALIPRPVVSLADLSRVRVRAEVDERDVGRLHVGQSVAILADAFPGRAFAGRVARLGAQMGRKHVQTGDPAEKSDRDVLEVFIDLDETNVPLVVGLRVTAQFGAEK